MRQQFLGLWIDEKLDWQYHIKKTVAKTRQMTYSMMKLKRFISREHQTIIYRGLIKPNQADRGIRHLDMGARHRQGIKQSSQQNSEDN